MAQNQSPNVKHKYQDSAISCLVLSGSGLSPATDSVFSTAARGVIVETGGDLSIIDLMGNQSIIPLPAGQFSICIKKVLASGSTAQGVTVLF